MLCVTRVSKDKHVAVMDSGSKKILQQLDEKIDKLRTLGVNRGLSASEIDDCILKCVNGEKNVKSSKKCSAYSRRRHFCRVASGVCAGVWAVIAGVYLLSLVHEPTDHLLAKALQPILYPFLRSVRLVGLPILRRYSDLAVYYDEECLIANPYYTPSAASCDTCETVTSVNRQPYEHFQLDSNDASFNDPAILTGGFKPVSLSKLMEVCREHVQELTEGVHLIDSSSPRIKALASLLNLTKEEVKADSNFHLTWKTRMVGPARVLRTIYSRPSFVNYQSEVALEKTILIDSPSAKSYTVPLSQNPFAWYVQSSGHRRLMLMPKSECASKCESFQITLNPGDMLYLFTDTWTITSLPVIGGEDEPTDASVGFIGAYTTD